MKATHRRRIVSHESYASDPGEINLAHDKLRLLRPDLYGLRGVWKSLLFILRIHRSERIYIEEQLQYGDSRAAVVVSIRPLLIAAYTDELDCVAILHFPDEYARQYQLAVGTRLLTVNCYGRTQEYSPDLILGPERIQRWTRFHPIIADFVSHDIDRIASRKNSISEEEWQRAFDMGMEYIRLRPGIARDGRPVYAAIPARRI